MNTGDNSEIRELKRDELEKVTGGGFVNEPRPPVKPAVLTSIHSKTGTVIGGSFDGGGGKDVGAGGGGSPYGDSDLHQLD
jgi:hypothetical protein